MGCGLRWAVLATLAFFPANALAQEIDFTGPLVVQVPKRESDEPDQVSIRAKPAPRSASDWTVDPEILNASPKQNGADAIAIVPGASVTERSALGRAPRLSLRGFEGTSGQDVEIFVGNVPLNQASNIRAPGYADMRLIMPEVIHAMRVSSGPYDPRQGDFAVAGSVHMDLGMDRPGFTGKGSYGSFDTRRVFLAFAPDDRSWRDTFAAFEAYGTDGPGSGRAGERASFVGQLAWSGSEVTFKGIAAIGSARFDFPGFFDRRAIEAGLYPYSSRNPLGRDHTSQGHLGTEIVWSMGEGTMTLGAFASTTKMAVRQDLTGFVSDLRGGLPPTNPDDSEQVNDAVTLGMNTAYKRGVSLLSKRDVIELGTYARLDEIDQTDTRLNPDGTRIAKAIDASIAATDLAAYVDASTYPIRHFVLRGGIRLDSLSYSVNDHLSSLGIEKTAQGFNVGPKVTADYAAGHGIHVVASYGDGFRSPQARTIREGDRVLFAKVHSVEAGLQQKSAAWRASLVGFGSWLNHDSVFDPLARENLPAPSSRREGVAGAISANAKPFAAAMSATYTHAAFTGSDATYHDGDPVPYAPRLVLRSDASITAPLGHVMGKRVTGKVGAGLEGTAERYLPGGATAQDTFFVDALASVAWRELELGVNGTNLLGLRYYDAQYLYASNFERSPVLPAPRANVLVAMPTTVLVTLEVHIEGQKKHFDEPDQWK